MLRAVPHAEHRARVLLVADHEVMRLGLRASLEASRRLEIVADVGTVAEALLAAAIHRPTLVLVAVTRADGAWINGCRELLTRVRDARLVMLDDETDETAAVAAARAGAVGCLSRRLGAQQLCRALGELADGERTQLAAPASERSRSREAGRDILALTAQERRVLQLVADGKTNKEIGAALGLSAKTVKNYLSHAFGKLNVSRRAQAAVLFLKNHVVEDHDHGNGFANGRSVR